MKSYRIISLEAKNIYRQEQINGKEVGYKMPRKLASLWLFTNKLDASLDTIELERVYKKLCGTPFSFSDKYQNEYTLAVVSLKFNKVYDPNAEEDSEDKGQRPPKGPRVSAQELRKYFYENGFHLGGVHYVRYKRSAGSSRDGTCLFIDERLKAHMEEWGECGLQKGEDCASWEAYKSLSLSSIKGLVEIPLEGILFVEEHEEFFRGEVVSVSLQDEQLVAEHKIDEVANKIWDGESLLDESLFQKQDNCDAARKKRKKHMLLLRNKFFKSCAFRTKLKKWIQDKGITLDDLKKRGVTLATDISQIVMVTTTSSLKYLKFAGALTEQNIRNWAKHAGSTFGVVKWDKRTRYFGGDMVRSSYQFLNTVGMSSSEAGALMEPNKKYLSTIRSDVDFMRYHFSDTYKREVDEWGEEDEKSFRRESDDEDEGEKKESEALNRLAQEADVLFTLMGINSKIANTNLYAAFRDDMVKNQKDGLLMGHLLLHGTNATIMGNGPQLLQWIAGEKLESTLKPGQIRCTKFPHGQTLLCARSPHITMGNLYLVTNNLKGEVWDYFDLGEQIVCVNAIGENVQQILNGCDYDSDAMLITDNPMLIQRTKEYAQRFPAPVCAIESTGKKNQEPHEVDYAASVNKIGEIVNLSQKLNSLIWDCLQQGDEERVKSIYLDVCKLAVLSGIEIDKAKRAYDKVEAGKELEKIRSRYKQFARPLFFTPLDAMTDDKHRTYDEEDNIIKRKREYCSYQTPMQYLYEDAKKIDYRLDSAQKVEYVPISSMLKAEARPVEEDLAACKKIKNLCEQYREKIHAENTKASRLDEEERDVIYKNIFDLKSERNRMVDELIQNENILMLLIAEREEKVKAYQEKLNSISPGRKAIKKMSKKKKDAYYKKREKIRREIKKIATDWYIYAPLFSCKLFQDILAESKERLNKIVKDPAGEYTLYEYRYRKE